MAEIQPGQVFMVKNQGTNITPETIEVVVHWVGPDTVHYYVSGIKELKSTSLERFIEIVSK